MTPEESAESRNRQALHQLDVDWGNGQFNYAKVRAILAGTRPEDKA
ncbi:hypothetical protein J2S94_003297 [Arthrobacter bambusae]|nr:hypothetical protein [Arthrobacter bambusae]